MTATEQRRERIRVPLAQPRGLRGALMEWWSRRAYGDILDPGLVMNHVPGILTATVAFERRVERWDALDPGLKALALTASAARIGCEWCLDFGYFAAAAEGLDAERLRLVPGWRTSDSFSATERAVLGYAEAMTQTPPEVDDAMVQDLVERLGVPAVVELTKMVAVENERSRFNAAMGLTSQGFSDRCEMPGRA